MRALSVLALGLILAGASGCVTQTIPGPLVVSTRPVPEFGSHETPAAKRVTGESCGRVALMFIPIGVATAEAAYEDALSQAPGADTIVNYEERMNLLFLFPLYYEMCTEIHGYAVSSKGTASGSASSKHAPSQGVAAKAE